MAPERLPLLALALLASEGALAAGHLKVLLCLGQPYTQSQLKSRRWSFFMTDLIAPQLSLAFLLLSPHSAAGGGVEGHQQAAAAACWLPKSLLLWCALGHLALHLFYIALWDTQHTQHVLALSSVRSMRQRLALGLPLLEVAWFLLGTAFDIATHLLLAAALLLQCWQMLGSRAQHAKA